MTSKPSKSSATVSMKIPADMAWGFVEQNVRAGKEALNERNLSSAAHYFREASTLLDTLATTEGFVAPEPKPSAYAKAKARKEAKAAAAAGRPSVVPDGKTARK